MPDSDVFECVRCGELIYHTENYCPHCGADLYPQEEEETEAVTTQRRDRMKGVWKVVAILILVGLLAPVLISVVPLQVLLPGAAIGIVGLIIVAVTRLRRERTRRRANLHQLLEELGLDDTE